MRPGRQPRSRVLKAPRWMWRKAAWFRGFWLFSGPLKRYGFCAVDVSVPRRCQPKKRGPGFPGPQARNVALSEARRGQGNPRPRQCQTHLEVPP